MNRLKKSLSILVFALALSFLLPSCMTTHTMVGQYKETKGSTYTYAKGKQMWLFWGIMPLGETNVNTPADGNCEIITKYRFTDVLVSGLTAGIVSSYSIKVKAKRTGQKHRMN